MIEDNGLLFGISWTLRTGEFSSSTTIGVAGSLNAPCMTHAGNLEYAWRHQCLRYSIGPNLLCIGCRQTDRCFLRIRWCFSSRWKRRHKGVMLFLKMPICVESLRLCEDRHHRCFAHKGDSVFYSDMSPSTIHRESWRDGSFP